MKKIIGLVIALLIILSVPFCAGGYDPVPLKGLTNKQKGRRGEEDVYDNTSEAKDRFVFDYDLPLRDCDERSKENKTKRED